MIITKVGSDLQTKIRLLSPSLLLSLLSSLLFEIMHGNVHKKLLHRDASIIALQSNH